MTTSNEPPTRRYVEGASPEERHEFGRALLASHRRRRFDPYVPRRVLRVNRLLLVVVGVSFVVSFAVNLVEIGRGVLLVPAAIGLAWFPNAYADLFRHYDWFKVPPRFLNPWVVLAWCWLALLAYGAIVLL